MFKYIFLHHSLSLVRKMNPKTLPIQILFTILPLLLLVNMIYSGYITASFIDSKGLFHFSTAMVRFFIGFSIIDMISRFFFQKLSSFNIEPYNRLLIPRKKLSIYNEFLSLFQAYNLWFFPVIISIYLGFLISTEQNSGITLFFLLLFLITLLNHSFIRLIKLLRSLTISISILFATVLSLILFLKSSFFNSLEILLINEQIFSIAMFLLLIILFFSYINIYLFGKLFFLDNQKSSKPFSFNLFKNFAERDSLMALELKMILRNKKPRETILMSFIITFSMLIISTLQVYPVMEYALFIMALSGGMGYLKFAFSWENQYWNFINANNISIREYFKTKYLISFHTSNITLIIALVFFSCFKLLDLFIIIQLISVWLLLQGIIYPFYLLFLSRMVRHINIHFGIMMNNDGITPVSLAIEAAFFIIPPMAFWGINQFLNLNETIIIMALPGIIGLSNLNKILVYNEKSFLELKHQILDKYQ